MADKANPKVIKFDSKSDIKMRFRANHSHELSKQLRDAGLRFLRVSPIERNSDLVSRFHIASNSTAHQIIVELTGIEYKDKSIIDDFLSFFLINNDYIVLHHGKYNTNGKIQTYFFIVEPVNQKENDKEMKAKMLLRNE